MGGYDVITAIMLQFYHFLVCFRPWDSTVSWCWDN